MASPWRLLKYIGKAVVKAAIKAIPLGEAVVEIASDAYEGWSKEADEQQRRAELQALAQAPIAEVNAQVAEVVEEVAADQAESVRQTITNYLTLMPPAIHRSLRRPGDPSGKTVPPQLPLGGPGDLIPLLPPRLPRFKPGDPPIANVDWELVELLGAGGFGEVWKARNPYFNGVPPVALKFCLDTKVAGTLRHEAAVLNRVMQQGKHPGIVPLLRTYLGADPPCLEYEFVGGGDLAGLIRNSGARGWPIRQAALVVQELAAVVAIAHHLSPAIVHRDLKPANILVQRTSDGKLLFRVADFGIGGIVAKQAIEEATRAGTTGSAMLATALHGSYTPLYASPQQTYGGPPDPRDDVYALGVIWYQLLLGNLSVGKPGGGKWRMKLAERGLTPQMADLLESCFEDDPADRPADAAILAEKLTKLLTVANAAVVSSRNPAVAGQAVTFTAMVNAVPSSVGTPTGTVTFMDGTVVLGSAALGGGTATLTTSALSPGSHGIAVTYAGDGRFPASTSPLLAQSVTPAPLTATAPESVPADDEVEGGKENRTWNGECYCNFNDGENRSWADAVEYSEGERPVPTGQAATGCP
ncbi:MAG TPA: Ig-like domain repeat protein, partial [Gemmataceae bacterium]|nr:Ig-like domain repeat protein [Gemmataceae bacterium]